jgi:protein SDA1
MLAAEPLPRRVVGVHKLLLLNFYPFLQKYIAPHQRDVTAVLATLAQAVHELVPPESLAPVLKQLVDQFVHDRCGGVTALQQPYPCAVTHLCFCQQ